MQHIIVILLSDNRQFAVKGDHWSIENSIYTYPVLRVYDYQSAVVAEVKADQIIGVYISQQDHGDIRSTYFGGDIAYHSSLYHG